MTRKIRHRDPRSASSGRREDPGDPARIESQWRPVRTARKRGRPPTACPPWQPVVDETSHRQIEIPRRSARTTLRFLS
jgi:hypothetical protein